MLSARKVPAVCAFLRLQLSARSDVVDHFDHKSGIVWRDFSLLTCHQPEAVWRKSKANAVVMAHQKVQWLLEMEDQLVESWLQRECLYNVSCKACHYRPEKERVQQKKIGAGPIEWRPKEMPTEESVEREVWESVQMEPGYRDGWMDIGCGLEFVDVIISASAPVNRTLQKKQLNLKEIFKINLTTGLSLSFFSSDQIYKLVMLLLELKGRTCLHMFLKTVTFEHLQGKIMIS